jgi:hypothetical protein
VVSSDPDDKEYNPDCPRDIRYYNGPLLRSTHRTIQETTEYGRENGQYGRQNLQDTWPAEAPYDPSIPGNQPYDDRPEGTEFHIEPPDWEPPYWTKDRKWFTGEREPGPAITVTSPQAEDEEWSWWQRFSAAIDDMDSGHLHEQQ